MAREREKIPASTEDRFAESTPAPAADLTPERMLDLIQRRNGLDPIGTAVVEDISPDGVAMVVLGGESRAREASSLLRFASAAAAAEALLGRTVLVLAPPAGPPVILGVVAQRLWEQRDAEQEVEAKLPVDGQTRTVELDRKRLDLEASDEIRLTCGKSSLVLRRDGTVVIRGVTITSRALQSNKIRGGTVAIN